MKHAIRWLSVVLLSIGCVGLLASSAPASNGAAEERFSAEESAQIRTLASKVNSAAVAVYMSNSDTFDTIKDILVAALDEFSEDGEYTPSAEPEQPKEPDRAAWWEMETLRLLVTNLEIAASEAYMDAPSTYSATVDTLTKVEKDINGLIKCSCPPNKPFCCCARCRVMGCDWQQCS